MAEMIELHSPRLLLRRWRHEDREPFAALNADAEVMRHFPACLGREQSDRLQQRIEADFAERGYGLWALQRRDNGAFIGLCGLRPVGFAAPFCPAHEIAWRLARAHWRQGLASEAARAVLECAFSRLGLEQVVAFTATENLASLALMRALGLRADPAGDFDHPLLPAGHRLSRHLLYRLDRVDWEATR